MLRRFGGFIVECSGPVLCCGDRSFQWRHKLSGGPKELIARGYGRSEGFSGFQPQRGAAVGVAVS